MKKTLTLLGLKARSNVDSYKKPVAVLGGALYTIVASANIAFAAELNPLGDGQTLDVIVGDLINLAIGLIGFVAFIYLLWAGFKYVTAGGDSKQADEAKTAIVHAIIGIVIALLSYVIVDFVLKAVGYDGGISVDGLTQ